MTTHIQIDPITRLEGHGRIEIFVNPDGEVERAFFQVPELRGFEEFCKGRIAEDLARITPRICGVCPTAHHMAAGKTLDDLYKVQPPPAARKIRELLNSAFIFEDHTLHFFYLGGPDFIVGPQAPKAERNILGVLQRVGLEVGQQVIAIRRRVRTVIEKQGGRVIHPVCNVPGGVSKGVTPEDRQQYRQLAGDMVAFAQFALATFEKVVLGNPEYLALIHSDAYRHQTYYMGTVDADNKLNLYDGDIRVVTPEGQELLKFAPRDYLRIIGEHVEPWSYVKFPFLKAIGWQGFVDGAQSGVYRVAPLARLNAADGMATPLAQEQYEKMFATLGGKPAHQTLAYHWARLVELLYCAERFQELAADEEICSPDIRRLPESVPSEGIGAVEAPRGTLIHHYQTDPQGRITGVNLLVATVHNAAAICMSIEKAARQLIKGVQVAEGTLNMIEMAFRAYDPCFACATHSLPGQMPLVVAIYDHNHNLIRELRRD